MIRRLRRKFILIAMFSVFAVLLLIMGAINVASYRSVVETADDRMELVLYPERYRAAGDFSSFFGGRLGREALFDLRFFSVTTDAEGNPVSLSLGSIAAENAESAVALSQKIVASGRTRGFAGDYRFRVLETLSGGTLSVFLDCSRELETFRSFLLSSVLVSVVGFVLVLIPVLFFSRLALRPVEESVDRQKRFLTDASHELKTPLAVISAANEVIEVENGASEWTESIGRQVTRLTSLTEKLVQLTRMDEEGFVLPKAAFDLSAAVEETALSFEAVAVARSRQFAVHVSPGIVYEGDETTLRQLVSLLVDNAMKYSEEGGSVLVTLEKRGKSPVLTVENTTDGIERGDLSVLFGRFYRRDKSRSSATGGHGVGLSVAEAIVRAHKGKITAFSPDGVRVIFTATL